MRKRKKRTYFTLLSLFCSFSFSSIFSEQIDFATFSQMVLRACYFSLSIPSRREKKSWARVKTAKENTKASFQAPRKKGDRILFLLLLCLQTEEVDFADPATAAEVFRNTLSSVDIFVCFYRSVCLSFTSSSWLAAGLRIFKALHPLTTCSRKRLTEQASWYKWLLPDRPTDFVFFLLLFFIPMRFDASSLALALSVDGAAKNGSALFVRFRSLADERANEQLDWLEKTTFAKTSWIPTKKTQKGFFITKSVVVEKVAVYN